MILLRKWFSSLFSRVCHFSPILADINSPKDLVAYLSWTDPVPREFAVKWDAVFLDGRVSTGDFDLDKDP